MAIHAGRHQFGMDKGRIALRTFRDGLAAQAGHDLTIEVARWSAELVVSDALAPESLNVTADLGSLIVRDGTGGLKPLTDRDKREIAVTARKVLQTERFPEAKFAATVFQPVPDSSDVTAGARATSTGAAGTDAAGTGATDSSGTMRGTITLAGKSGPLELRVHAAGGGRYTASGTIRQTDFGIKPYSGFFGALKVRDAVDIEVEVDLSAAEDQETAA
jgi:polyisoprenoid-binding protein YceI